MGGEITRAKGRERGPWYEIKCPKDVIISKESKGVDATFERGLLKAWRGHKGWEAAKEALASCGKPSPRA